MAFLIWCKLSKMFMNVNGINTIWALVLTAIVIFIVSLWKQFLKHCYLWFYISLYPSISYKDRNTANIFFKDSDIILWCAWSQSVCFFCLFVCLCFELTIIKNLKKDHKNTYILMQSLIIMLFDLSTITKSK